MNGNTKGQKQPLIDKHEKFKELSDQVTRQLEKMGGCIDVLERYKTELLQKEREKAIRVKMKELATQVNKMINQVADTFRELKVLKFSRPQDKESRKKTLKRLRGYFSRQHDRFTEALSSIQAKEKIYIEQRRSVLVLSGASSVSITSEVTRPQFNMHMDSFGDPEIEASIEDIDFFQVILEEREKQMLQIRGIAYDLKLAAEDQARVLKENQEDLENAVHHMSTVERNLEEGNNELQKVEEQASKKKFDSKCKRNVAVCLLVVILCTVVLVATLVTGVIKLN